MNVKQKWAAIKALDPRASIQCRDLGDFYIEDSAHVGDGSGIQIGKYGNGATPEEAVENHWEIYSTLDQWHYICGALRQDDGTYKRYRKRWNGFMWADVDTFELERIQRHLEKNNAN